MALLRSGWPTKKKKEGVGGYIKNGQALEANKIQNMKLKYHWLSALKWGKRETQKNQHFPFSNTHPTIRRGFRTKLARAADTTAEYCQFAKLFSVKKTKLQNI